MKLPTFDSEALSAFALKHGEKVVVGLVGLGAAALVWGGVAALRSLSVTDAQTPAAVERAATQARGHIDRDPQPPADLLPPRTPLADAIDPWRRPLVPWKSGSASSLTLAPAPQGTVFDSPLFEEAPKRSQPEVFPVEDLRAVAGIAILPAVAPPGQAAPGRPPAAPPAAVPATPPTRKPTERGDGRRPPRGGDPLAGGIDPPMPQEAAGPVQDVAEQGRVVPYVVVTGLIPVAKQQAEYRRRFESCGFRDPRRDSPLWCDYEIDRATIGPDGQEVWTRIDLAAVLKQRGADRADGAAAGVPAEFQLAAGEDARNRPTTPLPFCSSLPQRLDGTWELGDLHPWVVERLREQLAKASQEQDGGQRDQVEAGPGREGPDFVAPDGQAADQPVADAGADLPEYRLFRFIDTAVQPGATYRYRVRLKVWNPNYDRTPERMRPHLTDPALAVEPKLSSPESAASTATTVPDDTRILVAPLRRDEIKELRLRPGMLEVLVLARSTGSGTFSLRGLVGEPGVVVDVDEKFNAKNQRDRARGEPVVTKRLLVDARGRQEDRRDGPAEKEKPPGAIPEPLDVICLRPDGSFELATLTDSERPVERYTRTIPPRSARAEVQDPTAGDVLRAEPAVDSLMRPGAGR